MAVPEPVATRRLALDCRTLLDHRPSRGKTSCLCQDTNVFFSQNQILSVEWHCAHEATLERDVIAEFLSTFNLDLIF